MPFEIGKVFSPEALSLIQRKQEADKQYALDAYKMELARRQAVTGEKMDRRQMDLSERNADASRAMQERQMNLDRVQSDRAYGENTRQFDINKQMQERDQATREAGIGLEASKQDFEQGVRFPTESKLKALELTRKSEDSKARQEKYDAQVEQIKATTNLTNERARDLLKRSGVTDVRSALLRGAEYRHQFEALTEAVASGGAQVNPDEIEQAKNNMLHFAALLKTADPAAYAQMMKENGMSIEKAAGGAFTTDDPDQLFGVGAGQLMNKPPPMPRGK